MNPPNTNDSLQGIANTEDYRLSEQEFQRHCRQVLDDNGVLVLQNFLTDSAVNLIQTEAKAQKHLAYYTADQHTVYLDPIDPEFAADHPKNRLVDSSKGCITDDQIPADSALRTLYDSAEFRQFLCAVLNEQQLFEYADPLSSINIHYADENQELGWHFDNSSFAITLLIQEPEAGGQFKYVKDVRDADKGDMNFPLAGKVLDGTTANETLEMKAGTLVLFRGRNSMHKVTPVKGEKTRILAVLAYNNEANVSLSASARMTFFGRLG